MKVRGRKVGRIDIQFGDLQRLAEPHFAQTGGWTLTPHSALFRRKDGSYTLRLVWHSHSGATMTAVVRNAKVAAE